MRDEYDVIVVGAGPGGEVAAERCAHAGLATVVVERELVGGECSFWGCMPSKGLLRPGDVLASAKRVPGAREAITNDLDAGAALARRDEITANWDDAGQAKWLENHDVDLVRGIGRLAGARAVEVESDDGTKTSLRARRAVILATGSEAAVPPIDGLRDIRVWDNRGATEAHETPRRLLVLGGGVVGVEMAQAWRTLGADEVTIVEAADRLIPGEEPFAGEELSAALEAQGISVVTGTRMVAVGRDSDGAVTATLEDGRELTGDEILVAVGRRPRTRELGVETVGLEPGHSVDVDDSMRATGVDGGWLYAIGDVNGRALLTHMAKYHGRVAAAGIADGNGVRADHRAIPRIVFTDPQIAAVGMTEQQARDEGIEVGIARAKVSDVAGASVTGLGVDGTAHLVIDRARDVLVGATFTGPDVGAMLHAATVAIVGEVALDTLRHSVPVFPSLNEVWLNALQTYDDEMPSRAAAGSDKR